MRLIESLQAQADSVNAMVDRQGGRRKTQWKTAERKQRLRKSSSGPANTVEMDRNGAESSAQPMVRPAEHVAFQIPHVRLAAEQRNREKLMLLTMSSKLKGTQIQVKIFSISLNMWGM